MLSFEEWKAQKKQQEQGGGSAAEAAQETASGTGGKNGAMSFEQWREWKRKQQNETAVPPMPQQSNAQIVAGAREFTQEHQAAQQGKWNQWQTDYQKALAEAEAVAETTMPEPVQTEMEAEEEPVQVENTGSMAQEYARIAELAQQTYDAYIQSDEYRDMMRANMAAQAAAMQKASGIHSYTAAGQQTQVQEDQKEKELRAIRDYYRLLAQQAADREVMEADLAEFESWPMEDQLRMYSYIDNGMGSFYSLIGAVSGDSMAKGYTAQVELEEKYGADVVNRIMRSVSRSKNEKLAEEMAIIGKETGKDYPFMGSAATVPMNLIGTVATPVGYLSEAIRGGKGQYHTLDPNNIGNLPNVYTSNVRGQVAENIAGDRYDENGEQISDGGVLRQTAAYAYQGLMSSADSLARAYLGGGNKVISLGLAATGSFGQTMSEASERGASPAQALLMSVTNGGLEVATEYLPLDEILKVAKGGPVPAKKLLKNIFKQAAIEVTEEEVSYLGSLLAEAVILQKKSGYNQQIAEAVANGASYEDAVEQANRDVIWEAAETAFSSGFSGGISGAVSSTAANISNRGSRKTQEQQPILDQEQEQRNLQEDQSTDTLHEAKEESVQQEQPAPPRGEVRINNSGTAMLDNYGIGIHNTPEQLTEANRLAAKYGVDIRLYTDYSMEKESYVEDGKIFLNTESQTDFESLVRGYVNNQVQGEQEKSIRHVAELPDSSLYAGKETGATQETTEQVAGVAVQMQQDQNFNGGIINGSETTDTAAGTDLLHGSSQRHDSAGAREQTGSMAGSTGRAAQGKSAVDSRRTAAGRRNRIGSLRLPKISSAELGLKTGTEAKTVQLVPQEHWDAEMNQLADRIWQETGKQVSYVMGKIQIRGKSGRVINAKGVINGNQIIVQADHLRLSMEQIADHESYHAKREYFGQRLNQEVRQHIINTFSEEEFREVAEKYVEALRGVYDKGTMLSGEDFEQMMDYVQEEIFADAYAGINAFGAGADRFTSAVNEKMEQLHLGRYRSQENGVRETNGPPAPAQKNTADGGERYSFDGGNVIYPGMDESERAEILMQKEIRIPAYDDSNPVNGAQIMKLKGKYVTKAKTILTELARQCGAFQSDLYNAEINLDFAYSNKSLKESVSKQSKRGGGAEEFGKMLTVLPEICKNAVEIEAHTDRYVETARADEHLKEMHVLLGVFFDGTENVPVQLEIKEFLPKSNQRNKLYVTVTIKEAGVTPRGSAADVADVSVRSRPASIITIPELLANVKDYTGDLVKYFPDSMLTDEQRLIKDKAQTRDERRLKDMRYEHAVENQNTEKAEGMLREKAAEQGYSAEIDHRMEHRAPGPQSGVKLADADQVYGGDGSIYSVAAALYYGEGREYDGKAIAAFTRARFNPNSSITVYRAVPMNVRDAKLRNGDWVSPTKEYAQEHGERTFDNGYRIVSQKVPVQHLYVNGDSIHEFGYNNGRKNEVYKNTRNNVKLDEITYDDDGHLIPLSQRYDESISDERYSVDDDSETIVLDNQGRQLSRGQAEYFKDSKARDENGNLVTVYHSSPTAGFYKFDGGKGIGSYKFGKYGKAVTFFTDSKQMADSYAKDNQRVNTSRNGKIKDTVQNLKRTLSGKPATSYSGQYEGYVNITKPYVVDAEGRNWNRVRTDLNRDKYDRLMSPSAEERMALANLWQEVGENSGKFIDKIKTLEWEATWKSLDENDARIVRALQKVGDAETLRTLTRDNFDEEFIRSVCERKMTTNDIVIEAMEVGEYDGVIIRNVIDYSTFNLPSERIPGNLYITFRPEQFKAWDNTEPTRSKDIRYSIDDDTEGDGEGRIRFTDNGTAMLASMWGVNNTGEQLAQAKQLAAEYGVDIRLYTEYGTGRESYVEDGMIFLNTEGDTDFEDIVKSYVAGQKEDTARKTGYEGRSLTEGTETEDLSDFEKLRAEMKGSQRSRNEAYLRGKLSDENYEKYLEWEKQKNQEKQQERRKRQRERAKERSAQRKEAVKNTPKPKEKSRPTQAKRELRGTVMDLFSILPGERAELGRMIDNYADRLLRKESITEDDRRAFFDRLYEAGVMTVPADDYFRMGRELIKGGKVFVPESVRADFGDNWNGFRARAFGAGITITYDKSAAAGIDAWNHELASEIPGLFDMDETDLRTILERIVDIAEEGRDEMMSLADYTAMLADRGDITEDEFLDEMEKKLEEALRTFAKQANLEMRLKDKSKYQLAKERAAHKEMQQRQQERKQLREMQERTLKTLRWLKKNRHRAPEELQKKFDEVLGDLDLYAIGAAKAARWSDKYNATWEDVVEVYETSKVSDPNFFESAELERIASRLRGAKLEDLSIDALEDLYKLAIGLQTSLQNRDKVLNDERDRRIREVYRDSRAEIEGSGGKPTTGFIKRLFNDEQLTPMNIFQRMGGWNPNGEFYSMMKQLEEGERAMRAHKVKAQRMLEQFMREHADYVRRADGQGKNGIWYKVEIPRLIALEVGKKPQFGDNVTVYMTSAQKVHLYLESKHQQNLRHIAGSGSGGGRTFVNPELYKKGDKQQAFASGVTIRMAPETVKLLVQDLTEEEMELARILEQYYNTMAPQEINAVSNILYGYDKAVGGNYAPIFTNSNFTESKFGVFDATAEGVSNMKERQHHAVNATYNISCFDAFEKSVDQTARFVGMAIPIRNVKALLNTQEPNNKSMKEVISAIWRKDGLDYIEGVCNALQGQAPGEKKGKILTTIDRALGKLQSKYIKTTFGFNLSIALKQFGSVPLASAYLGVKNVLPAPGLHHNTSKEFISKYTQDLAWRTMGYAMPETKELKDNPNWTQRNKLFRFTFGGDQITATDGFAAKLLWPWAENKVRQDFPDLEMGTQEQIDKGESPFYKKVAEVFNDALARSQSTTDEIHQSALRKADSAFSRAFTMFRSDSAQTYNALRQKIGEAQYYDRKIKNRKKVLEKMQGNSSGADDAMLQELKKERQKARSAVGNVVMAIVLNAMWSEMVTFGWALLRGKHKRYKDEEDELSWESVLEEMGNGMLGSLAGIVTGGEEVFDIIGAFLTGDRWFGVESLGMEQLNTLIDTIMESGGVFRGVIADAINVHQEGGNFWEHLGKNWRDLLGGIKTIAETLAVYAGEIPVQNIEAVLLGGVKWISPELGAAYDDLWKNIDKDDLKGLSGGALEGRLGRILTDRGISEDGDTAAMLAQLYDEGHKNVVPGKIPTSVTVDGETQALDAAMQNRFSTAWSDIVAETLDELVSSDDFLSAEPEVQAKMVSYLYGYAGEMAKAELFENYEPDTRDETVAAFAEVGLDMVDFLIAYGKYNEIYNMEINNSQKADMFSHWVDGQGYTDAQAKTVRNELVYYNMMPAGAKKYNEMVENGVDPDTAYAVQQEMYKLDARDAEDVEYWRLAVNMSSEEYMQVAMLGSRMNDATFKKLYRAYKLDVSPDMFVTYYETRSRFDADGNGDYTQTEIKAVIDAMGKGYTMEQKGVLWQMATGSPSTKNNPYSKEAGQRWLDAKAEEKE